MEANISTIKHKSVKEKINKDMNDELLCGDAIEDEKKKREAVSGASTKRGCGGGGAIPVKSCQADKCSSDLSDAKTYHRRHKVCEHHAKAQMVVVAGIRQRFCQQCSRFHEVSEFDESKRSCRRRLAGHNERRRKNPMDNTQAEGSSSRVKGNGQLKDIVCG
ncbi:hypothetical protein BUALT_Bualt03G0193300 [Buddleja alternifolia]|uniref:SBP-type domain-containing protein n=1 Tax=Buddleja alternifolia TaxID=168488 RepID=A0AAV6XVZ7_9LAMI|nr:hypothetical protein BUALT_Bualt03G0193300 [Buddleja alternifolia]